MSKEMKKDMPDKEHIFDIDVQGDTTGDTFRGEFECRIMNRKERAMADKHFAMLNGGLIDQVSIVTVDLHRMIAHLRYSLTDYPNFWKKADLGYELFDINVIREVYEKVLFFEEAWFREIWGDAVVEDLKENDDQE